VLEGNKIFIGGLNYEITEKDLEATFSKFGTIINIRIVRDQETNSSKGFGFITFSSDSEANASLTMNGATMLNRAIGVKIAFNKRASKTF
jgi:RNA recognition motif-containing protein